MAASAGVEFSNETDEYITAALTTCQDKVKKIDELPAFCSFYFTDDFEYDQAMALKAFTPENKVPFIQLRAKYGDIETFTAESLESALKALADELGFKVRNLVMPARCACTGVKVGPSLYDLMSVLGRDRVLSRFDKAIAQMD